MWKRCESQYAPSTEQRSERKSQFEPVETNRYRARLFLMRSHDDLCFGRPLCGFTSHSLGSTAEMKSLSARECAPNPSRPASSSSAAAHEMPQFRHGYLSRNERPSVVRSAMGYLVRQKVERQMLISWSEMFPFYFSSEFVFIITVSRHACFELNSQNEPKAY